GAQLIPRGRRLDGRIERVAHRDREALPNPLRNRVDFDRAQLGANRFGLDVSVERLPAAAKQHQRYTDREEDGPRARCPHLGLRYNVDDAVWYDDDFARGMAFEPARHLRQ